MKRGGGFTLVELMIVVAIIGFLAAMAYPSYSAHVTRGKLAEGTSTLSDGRVKMEQYFQDNRTYASGSYAANGCPTTLKVPASTTNFTYRCADLTASTYTIRATGTGQIAQFIFTINQNNIKQTHDAADGWKPSTMPVNCWISKKGGQC